MGKHKMIPGGYGHGLSHCEYCKATDREIHFALGPVCNYGPNSEPEKESDEHNKVLPFSRHYSRLSDDMIKAGVDELYHIWSSYPLNPTLTPTDLVSALLHASLRIKKG